MPRMLLTADPSQARRSTARPRLARVQASIRWVEFGPIGCGSGQQTTIVKMSVDRPDPPTLATGHMRPADTFVDAGEPPWKRLWRNERHRDLEGGNCQHDGHQRQERPMMPAIPEPLRGRHGRSDGAPAVAAWRLAVERCAGWRGALCEFAASLLTLGGALEPGELILDHATVSRTLRAANA